LEERRNSGLTRMEVACDSRREPRGEQGAAQLLGGLLPGEIPAEAAQQDLTGGEERLFQALLQRRGARGGARCGSEFGGRKGVSPVTIGAPCHVAALSSPGAKSPCLWTIFHSPSSRR